MTKQHSILQKIKEERARKIKELSDLHNSFTYANEDLVRIGKSQLEKQERYFIIDIPVLNDRDKLRKYKLRKFDLFEKRKKQVRPLMKKTLEECLKAFLDERNNSTWKSFAKTLEKNSILFLKFQRGEPILLSEFSHSFHGAQQEDLFKKIKTFSASWNTYTREQCIKFLKSFIRYLHEYTKGEIPLTTSDISQMHPSKRRDTYNFLSLRKWTEFFSTLEDSENIRDLLACRLLLYCGNQVSIKDVLSTNTHQLNFRSKRATFGNKSILCSNSFFRLLRHYVEKRSGHVFITETGNTLQRAHLNKIIRRCATNADIKEKISPETIRASIEDICRKEHVRDLPYDILWKLES